MWLVRVGEGGEGRRVWLVEGGRVWLVEGGEGKEEGGRLWLVEEGKIMNCGGLNNPTHYVSFFFNIVLL